jgi:hypothetical protein
MSLQSSSENISLGLPSPPVSMQCKGTITLRKRAPLRNDNEKQKGIAQLLNKGTYNLKL